MMKISVTDIDAPDVMTAIEKAKTVLSSPDEWKPVEVYAEPEDYARVKFVSIKSSMKEKRK